MYNIKGFYFQMSDWYVCVGIMYHLLEELKCSLIMNGDNGVITKSNKMHLMLYALRLDILPCIPGCCFLYMHLPENSRVWIYDINCTGNESTLLECPSDVEFHVGKVHQPCNTATAVACMCKFYRLCVCAYEVFAYLYVNIYLLSLRYCIACIDNLNLKHVHTYALVDMCTGK